MKAVALRETIPATVAGDLPVAAIPPILKP